MKQQQVTSVLLGAVLAGIAWVLWWPTKVPVSVPKEEPRVSEPLARSRSDVDLMARLRRATTDEERLALAQEAAELSPEKIEILLDEGNPRPGNTEDDFGNIAMLLAWGQVDPEAALEWAFKLSKTNGEKGWEEAWKAVGAEWAISDSTSFVSYVTAHLPKEGEEYRVYRSHYSGPPVLEFGIDEFEWLLRAEPGAYMKAHQRYAAWGSHSDEDFVASLEGAEEYELVLSTWEHFSPEMMDFMEGEIDSKRAELAKVVEDDPKRGRAQKEVEWAILRMDRRTNPKENPMAQNLIGKWAREDPEGFAESRFAGWKK